MAEQDAAVPFPIKRVYWINSGLESSTHGHHAHCNAHQMLICVSGAARVEVTAKDGLRAQFDLERPDRGLHIPPAHWLVVRMDPESTLLCLSSVLFSEQQTVHDLNEFLRGR